MVRGRPLDGRPKREINSKLNASGDGVGGASEVSGHHAVSAEYGDEQIPLKGVITKVLHHAPPSSLDALKGQRLLPDRQDPFVDRLRRTEVRTAKIVGDITTCLR